MVSSLMNLLILLLKEDAEPSDTPVQKAKVEALILLLKEVKRGC